MSVSSVLPCFQAVVYALYLGVAHGNALAPRSRRSPRPGHRRILLLNFCHRRLMVNIIIIKLTNDLMHFDVLCVMLSAHSKVLFCSRVCTKHHVFEAVTPHLRTSRLLMTVVLQSHGDIITSPGTDKNDAGTFNGIQKRSQPDRDRVLCTLP